MPLPLPKSRPDRPRRRVVPITPQVKPPPVRTYSFDPNAARQAWRQVARTRGAHGMRLDGRDSGNLLAPLALGILAIVAGALWWLGGDEEPPPAESQAAVVAQAEAEDATPTRPWRDGDDDSGLGTTPDGTESPRYEDYDDGTGDEPLPPAPPASHTMPEGTPEDNAKALRKLPHSPHDRGPVGGIGKLGLHIDRITMGTDYDGGACSGPVGKFSIRDDKRTNVCFRAVHPRTRQTVIVLWEHEGKVRRRTFVSIGDSHGYRTRAALNLRRSYAGQWKVRIMSPDGIELATQEFEVLR